MSEVYKVEGPGGIAPGTKLVLKKERDEARDELRLWLTPLREAFGLVSTLAPHRIADPSHPIDWAKGIVKDVHEQQDRIVEEVRKAEAVAGAASNLYEMLDESCVNGPEAHALAAALAAWRSK